MATNPNFTPPDRTRYRRPRKEGRLRGGFIFLAPGSQRPVQPWPWEPFDFSLQFDPATGRPIRKLNRDAR